MQYQHPTHPNTHRNTHSHIDVNSVFSSSFTFVGLLSLTQSWAQVLSTIDLSQLIDFYSTQLLCHCYVIVLRCFCPDLKITSPDFVWRVYTTSYPVLTHKKSGTAATERDRFTQKMCLRLQYKHTHGQVMMKLVISNQIPLKVREPLWKIGFSL